MTQADDPGREDPTAEHDDEQDHAPIDSDADTEEPTPGATPRRRQIVLAGARALALAMGVGLGRLSAPPAPGEQPGHTDHAGHDHGAGEQGGEAATWTCSMHPQIQSPEPGACPICGMDLIPADDASAGPELTDAQVRLGPRARALARIRTSPVRTSSSQGAPRALFGRVVEDEEALRAVTSWIAGRIDRLSVSTTGARVRRGQALAQMYSPEVYAAHRDLLVAREQLARLEGADAYARRSADGQVASARQRLRLLGFTASELTKMERAEEPWTRVPVRATASGTVRRRLIRQGEYVEKGQVLFELADLGTVWVELDAYESDLEALEVGQTVSLRFGALPGAPREATITFIDPVVDPQTRVAAIRVEVDNPDGGLKPGMTVDATLKARQVAPGQPLPLVIPASAPLFAGARSLVYVEVGSGDGGTTYEAREVALGARVGEEYIVRAGLARGERVVTHGAFALDSDLQIRGNLSLMARPDDTTRPAGSDPIELDAQARASLRPVLTGYLDVGEALAADDLAGALERARAWRASLGEVALEGHAAAQAWGSWSRRLDADLARLAGAPDLGAARAHFSEITGLYDELLGRFGNPLERPIRKAYCPMVRGDQGDHWYQRAEQVDNVYFGDQMRRCGEIQRVVGPGEYTLELGGASGGGDVE
jgi:Cu(I)/Ag(I) efflux system membrane fusion protein